MHNFCSNGWFREPARGFCVPRIGAGRWPYYFRRTGGGRYPGVRGACVRRPRAVPEWGNTLAPDPGFLPETRVPFSGTKMTRHWPMPDERDPQRIPVQVRNEEGGRWPNRAIFISNAELQGSARCQQTIAFSRASSLRVRPRPGASVRCITPSTGSTGSLNISCTS